MNASKSAGKPSSAMRNLRNISIKSTKARCFVTANIAHNNNLRSADHSAAICVLPAHLATTTTMNAVHRRRSLAATSTMTGRWLTASLDWLAATEVVGAVISFQRFVSLKIAHLHFS
jgi:hypothetical protein